MILSDVKKNKKQLSMLNYYFKLKQNFLHLDVILPKKNVKNYLLNVVEEINLLQKKIEINGFDLNLNL
jgi:hypothetical protein